MASRILIRHLAGSKISQVEQFPIENFPELSIGREPGATVLFDVRDDAVSRKHAVIRVVPGDPPSFKLGDLGSSNGTFLNGERIDGETELLPGDTIELGAGGPKFRFDVEPRPADLVARTRIMSAARSAPTRVIDAVDPAPVPAPTRVPIQQEAKPNVGRDTVMRLLSEQRQTTSRIGLYALAGVLAVILLAGGALYYKNQRDVAEEAARVEKATLAQNAKNQELATQIQQQQQMLPTLVNQQLGENARGISEKYSGATVLIDVQWRLYDRETGKPLFHKTFSLPGDRLLPAYVIVKNRLYRWLTTEDEEHSNFKVGSDGQGTGFLIDSQGLIVTNKHVAAGWLIDYNSFSNYETGDGIFVEEKENVPPYSIDPKRKALYEKFVLDHHRNFSSIKQDFQREIAWYPQDDGGPIFANRQPIVIGNNEHTFEGRNELLEVRFPGKVMNISARLVRASTDADAALIKIDATETLTPVPLATDDVKIGDHVVVLGYPYFSVQNRAVFATSEQGKLRNRREDIPEPTVTEGIISNISLPRQRGGDGTVSGSMGDVYQMTLPSGAGNSGGPVFNSHGNVLGLFTYASIRETTTYAVPIRYARDLLQMQRTSN